MAEAILQLKGCGGISQILLCHIQSLQQWPAESKTLQILLYSVLVVINFGIRVLLERTF